MQFGSKSLGYLHLLCISSFLRTVVVPVKLILFGRKLNQKGCSRSAAVLFRSNRFLTYLWTIPPKGLPVHAYHFFLSIEPPT